MCGVTSCLYANALNSKCVGAAHSSGKTFQFLTKTTCRLHWQIHAVLQFQTATVTTRFHPLYENFAGRQRKRTS